MSIKRLLPYLFVAVVLLLGAAPAASAATGLDVTKTVSPAMIYEYGSGDAPDYTTVTITVSGVGGEEAVPMDVVFCIDSSGSMQIYDPTNLRIAAAQSFVDKMSSPPDQAGVVSWDDNIDFTYGLTTDFTALKAQIDNVDAIGNTNGNLGLSTGIGVLDANPRTEDSVEVIVFLTDGQFNMGGDNHNPALTAECLAKGYVVYTIGLGDSVDSADLTAMATETGGQYFPAPDAASLQAVFDAIFETVNTAPQNVDVVEVTQPYITAEGSFSVAPSSYVDPVFRWDNIAAAVGDNDAYLEEGETWTVEFTAGSTQCGLGLAVQTSDAKVYYDVYNVGTDLETAIPQATLDVICPAIAVDKTADDTSVYRGDTVTYFYEVTNPGNIALTNVILTDDKVTPYYVSGDDGNGKLDVTETWIYQATAQPTNTVTNTATVTGTDPLGKEVRATDSETVVVTVRVEMDVKPGSCPNAFKVGDKGVLPVALVGGVSTYTLDEINLDSVKLNGVPFVRYAKEDAATPYFGQLCGCTMLTADGFMDVSYKFDHPKVAATLGSPAKKAELQLTMTGVLKDGVTLLEGKDCIVIS